MNNDAKRIAAELVEVICFAVGFAVIAQFLERSGFHQGLAAISGLGLMFVVCLVVRFAIGDFK